MDIYDDVAARLLMLGYTVSSSDAAVTYSINRASETIKANINRIEIPEGLRYVWTDMSAGLFLRDKKAAGQLGDAFDFSAPAKNISEGDVSVEFAGSTDGALTPEARFDNLLDSLINPPQSVYAAFRRLKW
jgi:hypothetical protein